MQIVSVESLLNINETLIVQFISFLIFLFIINRVMFRPLRALIKKRDEHVDNVKKGILDAENAYKTLLDQIKAQESAVKTEAFAMRKKLEESGSEEAAAIIESSRQEIMNLKNRVGRELEDQISAAKAHVKKESEALAVVIMEKVLDRRLQP
jgi:F-type H+-transporting ATPase subunit b